MEELEKIGLFLLEEVITKEEESYLLDKIGEEEWENIYSRRTIHYGYSYDYKRRRVEKIERDVPEWLVPSMVKRIMNPNQIIINEYRNGQGIHPHTDADCFGPTVCILSLIEETEMELSLGDQSWSLPLPPRSLLIMRRDARWKMKHSISFRGDRRVSLTYRTV